MTFSQIFSSLQHRFCSSPYIRIPLLAFYTLLKVPSPLYPPPPSFSSNPKFYPNHLNDVANISCIHEIQLYSCAMFSLILKFKPIYRSVPKVTLTHCLSVWWTLVRFLIYLEWTKELKICMHNWVLVSWRWNQILGPNAILGEFYFRRDTSP